MSPPIQGQLDVCISGVSSVIQRNSDNSEAKCTFYALIPCFIVHFWFVSDFRQVPRRTFLKFFPFFCPLLLLLQLSSFAWGMGLNLCTKLKWCSELLPFPAIWSSWILGTFRSMRGLLDSSASKMWRKFWIVIIFPASGHPVPAVCFFTRHCRCCSNFQLSQCIHDDLFELLILKINEINSSHSSCILELWFFTCPISFEFLDKLLQISGHKWSGLDVACRFVSPPPDHMDILLEDFLFAKWIVWNLSKNQTNLLIHRYSNNHPMSYE